jgi:hypothetical protein
MFQITPRVTCVCATPGVYRFYYQSRWVGEGVTVDNDALYVSQFFIDSGSVVGSLLDAAHWLEAIEGAVGAPLAAD